jgi:anaerobic magnesium-protoporphyrin IX monomethyl ester cyclase
MPGLEILLAHAYFSRFDPKQTRKMKPYPPLATLHVAGYLRRMGHRVALFDAMLSAGEHEFQAMLARERPRLVVLFEDNFNFLSKMCLSRMREAAQTLCEMAAAAGCVVVASGSDISDRPELYLARGADAVALGEGDHAVAEIAALLASGLEVDRERWAVEARRELKAQAPRIPGLAFLGPAGVQRSEPRPPERKPDVFGLPAWDLVNFSRYEQAWRAHHGRFSLNMASTRGCPFHCNWCAKPIWGQRYATRSPANVAEEMTLLKTSVHPDHIWFADDIFGLRLGWVTEFAREVAARHGGIPFTIQSRVDLMTEDAVEGLKTAGCVEVWLGAESGSQRVLDAMDKGIRVDEIFTARARLRRAGIRACFFVQFGYPGETWQDIRATIDMIAAADPDEIGVSVSYPLPGTRFHGMVQAELGAKLNWTDSDDLEMLFQGAYPTAFYRALRDFAHLDLDARHAERDALPEAAALALQRDQAWARLRALEPDARHASPTRLVKPEEILALPDLSRGWN